MKLPGDIHVFLRKRKEKGREGKKKKRESREEKRGGDGWFGGGGGEEEEVRRCKDRASDVWPISLLNSSEKRKGGGKKDTIHPRSFLPSS